MDQPDGKLVIPTPTSSGVGKSNDSFHRNKSSDKEAFLGIDDNLESRFKPGTWVEFQSALGSGEVATLDDKFGKIIRYSPSHQRYVVRVGQEQKMICPHNLKKTSKVQGVRRKASGLLSRPKLKTRSSTTGAVPMENGSNHGIPSAVWTKNLVESAPSKKVHQPARPPVCSAETVSMIPLAARLGTYVIKERAQCRDPFFDLSGIDLHPPDPGPYAGVPLGGIGCGSINRGYRGDFRRWSLIPGRYFHKVHHGCQFSVRMLSKNKLPGACVLVDGAEAKKAAAKNKKLSQLKSWNWGMKPACATYHALFPRAWTVYNSPLPDYPGVVLVCRQISPVIGSSGSSQPQESKGEYVESSFPCSVFEWTIENNSDADVDVSLMFSWEAAAGVPGNRQHVSKYHAPFQRCNGKVFGVEMKGGVQSRKVYDASDKQDITLREAVSRMASKKPDMHFEDSFSYAIACAQEGEDDGYLGTTCCPYFATSSQHLAGEVPASNVWANFVDHGCLQCELEGSGEADEAPSKFDPTSVPTKEGRNGSSALCHQIVVPHRSKRVVKFALSWDVPVVRFGSGNTVTRWYTRFFGRSGDAAPSLCAWALHRSEVWEKMIASWQAPVLNSVGLPDFYKHLLFNELYYIVDGGGLWTEGDSSGVIIGKNCLQHFGLNRIGGKILGGNIDEVVEAISSANNAARRCSGDASKVGRFLYLEGHEYLMYNTYDVHFYGSWALIMNWPQLQLSLQRDVITAIAAEDLTVRTSLAEKQRHERKVAGVVPHDVGSPCEEPWVKLNTYNLQDVSRWKDLGPKFVLQVYRDYCATRDLHYLRDAWPTMLNVMNSMEKYDRDQDGLIENDGYPDQTYDVWTVRGASAYTGGLWVASLSAMFATANSLIHNEHDFDLSTSRSPNNFKAEFLRQKAEHYQNLWRRARHSYVDKLWCGTKGYFNYDCSGSPVSDSCMSDQCCGEGWARACGLPSVCDEDESGAHACSAMLSVLDLNVYRFGELSAAIHGQSDLVIDSKGHSRSCFLAGAINGMRPASNGQKGVIDNSCLQSREVWTGTSYGLAGAMLQESKIVSSSLPGMRDKLRKGAFDVVKGLHHGGWKAFGYWFATPEAWEVSGNVRCMGYMRPLSIWCVQWALREEMPQEEIETAKEDEMKEKENDGTSKEEYEEKMLVHFRQDEEDEQTQETDLVQDLKQNRDSGSSQKNQIEALGWGDHEDKESLDDTVVASPPGSPGGSSRGICLTSCGMGSCGRAPVVLPEGTNQITSHQFGGPDRMRRARDDSRRQSS